MPEGYVAVARIAGLVSAQHTYRQLDRRILFFADRRAVRLQRTVVAGHLHDEMVGIGVRGARQQSLAPVGVIRSLLHLVGRVCDCAKASLRSRRVLPAGKPGWEWPITGPE